MAEAKEKSQQEKAEEERRKAKQQFKAATIKEFSGKTEQSVGKRIGKSGRVISRAGAGLSKEGPLGAIVGTPLRVGGTAARVLGIGMRAHGKERVARAKMEQKKAAARFTKSLSSGKSEKISKITAYLMVSVALLFDFGLFLINFIPIVGNIISFFLGFIAYMIFIFWFLIKGVKLMTGKRLATMGTGFIISIIPIINALPAVTASVVLTILSTKVKSPPLVKK